MRLGGIFRRKKTKREELNNFVDQETHLNVKMYFEREEPLPDKITPKQLEKRINDILRHFSDYGNVIVELQHDFKNGPLILRVYMEEMKSKDIYVCRVHKSKKNESMEEVIKTLHENSDISNSAKLIDVIRHEDWKILIFKQ